MPSDDDQIEGVRIRLRGLYDVLEGARQTAVASGGGVSEQTTLFNVLSVHLDPALEKHSANTAASDAVTLHLARMALGLVEPVQLPGPAFRPVRDAIRQLRIAHDAAQSIRDRETAEHYAELKALIQAVAPDVQAELNPILQHQHGETLDKLDGLQSAVARAPAQVATAVQPGFDGVKQAVTQVPAGVLAAVQPNFDRLDQAVAQVPADVLATFQPALNHVDDLLTQLPQRLSDTLIKSLPAAVAAVLAALRQQPSQPSTPVIFPVNFPDLAALAAAQASNYIVSGGQRIVFLQAALTALQNATQAGQTPTPLQLSQITTVILAVINYVDPALTPTDLYAITSYKQQFTSVLGTLGP